MPTNRVTVTENDNLYNKIAGVINNIIPGEILDLPKSTTTTTQPVEYNIRDKDGNIIETLQELPEEYKPGRKLYRTDDGGWTYHPTSKVTLDPTNGHITVSAPDFVLERDGFKEQFGSQLETLSRYYQQSPTAMIPQSDGSFKTIPQVINSLNDPESASSLQKYTDAVIAMQDQELGYKGEDGSVYVGDREAYNIPDNIKLNDSYFQLRNTMAIGDDVKNDTLQAVPKKLAQAEFLRSLDSYNEDTGTVQFKDLMDNAYNLDVDGVRNEDERLKQLKAGLEEYFAQGDYEDTDEFARSVALYEFITHKAPDAKWYQTVAYTVGSFVEGVADYEMNANTFSPFSEVSVQAMLRPYIALEKTFTPIINSMQGKGFKVTSSIEDIINAQHDSWIALEDQRQADRIYLSPAAAAAKEIGYGLASLATLISAGNAAENVAKGMTAGAANTIRSIGTQTVQRGVSASALHASISDGVRIMVTVSNPGVVAKMANIVANIVGSKAVSVVSGLVAETFAEAITGNPDKFYRVIRSEELTEEAKQQLWDDFIGNAVGLTSGVAIGRGLISLSETTKGRAISLNIARGLAKLTTSLGDEWAQIVAKIHGAEDVTEYISKLAGDDKSEKALALLSREIIRDVKKGIAEQDYIEVFGRSEEDILKSINEVEESVHTYRAFENAVDEWQRKGLGIVSEWLDAEYNVKLGNANKAMQDVYESLRKAENSVNISGVTKVGKLAISQETTNYISALLKRDIVNSAIRVLEGDPDRVSDVTELRNELEKANGVINGYEELVGGNQNILQNAKKFSESLKNFYAEANNLLVREGLINKFELEDLRASGLWGENGELYVHFHRDIQKNQLMPLQFRGSFRRDTVEYLKHYVHGSDAAYLDPLVTSRLYLRRYADAAARQEVVKQYVAATGKGEELLSAADTEAARILNAIKPVAEKQFAHAAKQAAGEIRKGAGGPNDDLIKLFAQTSKESKNVKRAEKALSRRQEKYASLLKKGLGDDFEPSARHRRMATQALDADRLKQVWTEGLAKKYGDAAENVTLYKYLSDNYDNLPQSAKAYLNECYDIMNYAAGRTTGIKVRFEGSQKANDVQEIVNRGRGRSEDVVDKFLTPSGQKEAMKRALRRNGLADNVLSPGNALDPKKFEGKDLREIRKIMRGVFGDDLGDAIIAKAQKAPNGKVRKTKDLGRHLRPAYNEVMLNRDGSQMSKRGMALYEKMTEHQTRLALTEDLQKLRELNSANINAVRKMFPEFDDQMMRRIVASDNETFNTDGFTKEFVLNEAKSEMAKQLFVHQVEYDELSEMIAVPNEVIARGIDQGVTTYVNKVLQYPEIKKAYAALSEYYGLDSESAQEYLALRALMEHKGGKLAGSNMGAKKNLSREIGNRIREDGLAKLAGDEKAYMSGRLSDAIWKRIEERYNDLRVEMQEFAPAFVDSDKMFDEVNALTSRINDYKKDVDNVVAIQDEVGRVSFMKTDPLLATMMNHETVAKPLTKREKANYLLSKTFRLGTTSLNLKSLVNQTFRDFGNAFIGGNMYRTWSQAKLQMSEVLGENVVDWIRRSDADLADYIVEMAEKTGKAESEVAFETIKGQGSRIAPTTSETDVYRRAAQVSTSIEAGKAKGVDKLSTNGMKGTVAAIDSVGDRLGKVNEMREVGLRNLVYQNGFADAVKRGYSFTQAKQYATFLMDNATTNFGRTSVMFSRMQRTVPFLGAAINGTTSFYRLLSVDPVGVIGRLVGGIIIPTAYLTAGSLLTAEDRKLWKNIKEYEKDDNILFISNGQVFSIPIPQEISAWINPIRHIIEKDAGANMHSIMQLAVNDILGLSPIDLDGFANIDASMMADGTDGENFFVDNVEPGLAKLFSQLAPVPMKAAMMWVTGIDPYTMKKIDKTYSVVNPDTGEMEIMNDYSSSFAKLVSKFVSSNKGFEMSAPMAEKLLGSIIGSAPVEYIGWLVDVGDAVINNKDIVSALSSSAEGAVDMITAPVTVPQYRTKAEDDWKAAVNEMYELKESLLMSDEWQDYQNKKRNATTAEELTKLAAVRSNLTRDYYSRLQGMVDNLKNKYEADFTAEKYAAIISLSVLDQTGVDSTAYGQDLSDELYKDAKNRAVDTMFRMGFQSPSDYSVFGYLTTGQDGTPYVAMSTPMSILQLRNNMNYAKNLHQANMQSIIESRGLQKNGDAYRAMEAQVDQIYAKGNLTSEDYDAISNIYKQWDAQVMTALYPYLKQNGIKNVLENSDTVEALNDVIKVPSDFAKTKQGRYFSSPGLNKQAGYAKAYIEYVYNLIEEQ